MDYNEPELRFTVALLTAVGVLAAGTAVVSIIVALAAVVLSVVAS